MGLIKNAYKLSLSDEQIEQIKLGETVKITVNDTIIHISRRFPDEKELKRRATPLQEEIPLVEFKIPELHEKLIEAIDKMVIPKEEKMAHYKMILSKCEKMAKKYGLNMEGEWDSIRDKLEVTFSNGPIRKVYSIYDVCMRDPRMVLEPIERNLIKKFNIDLNKFEPEDMWIKVAEYCDNDVIATEAVFNHLVKVPPIKNVIFNDPATIIFWTDGTKTVVKAQDEAYDPEKGMAMAIAKKALGNQGNYCNIFKKWLPEEEEEFEINIDFAEAGKRISETLKKLKKKEDKVKIEFEGEEMYVSQKFIDYIKRR